VRLTGLVISGAISTEDLSNGVNFLVITVTPTGEPGDECTSKYTQNVQVSVHNDIQVSIHSNVQVNVHSALCR